MKKLLLPTGMLAAAALVQTATGQVIVSDDFNYGSLASLQANWSNPTGLTLETENGNPAPSGGHDGSASAHNWTGGTFSVIPTAANPLVLTVDIFSTGAGNQRNTVGLRSGANPLFEMGIYNAFGVDDSGLGELGNGVGVRILNFAGNEGWVKLDAHYTGWSRWEATFTDVSLDVRIDHDLDGTWEVEFNSTGTTPSGAFSDLRFGGPSALASAGGGFAVDNVVLQTIPEPSGIALLALGALAFGAFARRRK